MKIVDKLRLMADDWHSRIGYNDACKTLSKAADEIAHLEEENARLREQIAQPMDGWLPTPENINALPEPLRKYIADLETNADPAGTVRENTIGKDTLTGLEMMLEEAKAENAALREELEEALAAKIRAGEEV